MRKALILIGLFVGLVAPVTNLYAQTTAAVVGGAVVAGGVVIENNDDDSDILTPEQQLIQNALPEGVTFSTATAGQLNRALKKVARENPRNVETLKAVTKVVVDTGKVTPERAATTVTRVAIRSLSRTPAPTPTTTASAPEVDVIVEVVKELIESQNLSTEQITDLVTTTVNVVDASSASNDQVNEVAQGLGVVLRENPDTADVAADIIKDVTDNTGVVITSKSGTTSTASLL